MTGLDRFNRISTDQQTVFYGLRSAPPDQPASAQQVILIAHMGGADHPEWG
ncbi:MAG: hypothetical protein HC812_13135 [Leptolyngbya sp. RL_3_1]|nr:hypothetical protein [Leptolyngbya sp. RL_3_1]